jgi:K+-transporting ATPase A subunit
MSKKRYTSDELDARLKFFLGMTLGTILLFTTMGILYALVFVTQPIGEQSENDKMFFNVLSSVATFITGTLAGILIGKNGGGSESTQTSQPYESQPIQTSEPVVSQIVDDVDDLDDFIE